MTNTFIFAVQTPVVQGSAVYAYYCFGLLFSTLKKILQTYLWGAFLVKPHHPFKLFRNIRNGPHIVLIIDLNKCRHVCMHTHTHTHTHTSSSYGPDSKIGYSDAIEYKRVIILYLP